MRKRSKYRPKGLIYDVMGYVMESMTPVEKHGSYLLDLRIKNHAALTALTQGKATKEDVDVLIASFNVTEALYRMGFGVEYGQIIAKAQDTLRAVGRRGMEMGRFILRAEEMQALNLLMELHDAQMEVVTVKDIEQAIKLVQTERRQRKMKPILESA